MSGIIAVYGLVVAVLIAQDLGPPSAGDRHYSLFEYASLCYGSPEREHRRPLLTLPCRGSMHLACGLSVGMTGLAAGYCIGVVGDKGVRAYMEQSRVFVGMILILIFGEVLGLYG